MRAVVWLTDLPHDVGEVRFLAEDRESAKRSPEAKPKVPIATRYEIEAASTHDELTLVFRACSTCEVTVQGAVAQREAGDLELLAFSEPIEVELERCGPYKSKGQYLTAASVFRIRSDARVKVFEASTGALVLERVFRGGVPPPCPKTATFEMVGGLPPMPSVTGQPASAEEIGRWIDDVAAGKGK